LGSISSTERPNVPRWTSIPRRRIPAILALATLILGALAAIPTILLGGPEAVANMAVGALASLFTVAGGFWLAQLAFRGPDRFATKLVVGGFVVRMVLLFAAATALVAAGLRPAAFVLWLVTFYFALILLEAWILARQPLEGDR
jgi:hypothetical protein